MDRITSDVVRVMSVTQLIGVRHIANPNIIAENNPQAANSNSAISSLRAPRNV